MNIPGHSGADLHTFLLMLTLSEKQFLRQSVTDLGRELLQQAQDAHGFFTTKTRYAIGYSDPVARQQVQEKLDHAVALLAIANIMAIFEDRLPRKYWTKIFQEPAITVRLKAYRHIRFSAINGFIGTRASENKLDFDKTMSGNSPLRGVRSYDDESVFLDESAASFALSFLNEAYSKAVVKVHQL